MDIVKHNEIAWDKQSSDGESPWVQPVGSAEIAAARRGNWRVILTPTKTVPEHWFDDIGGKDVLGLASGGGQRVPTLPPPALRQQASTIHPNSSQKTVWWPSAITRTSIASRAIWLICPDSKMRVLISSFTRYRTCFPAYSARLATLRPGVAARWALAERIHEPRLFYV